MYADDICLLTPNASAMQYLLDVCYDYGIEHDIVPHILYHILLSIFME